MLHQCYTTITGCRLLLRHTARALLSHVSSYTVVTLLLHCPTLLLHCPTLSNTVQHCPTLSNTVQHCPTLSNTVQHCCACRMEDAKTALLFIMPADVGLAFASKHTLLLHCCHTVVTLLLHCCHTVLTLFLHCSYTVLTLLLHSSSSCLQT
jgi:hypothetical protein